MKQNRLVISGYVLIALAMVPAACAAAASECIVPKPTAASATWNFQREANKIFEDVRFDAGQATNHAEELQSMVSRADSLTWLSDVTQLDQIRTEVNDMGVKLCRLETIRRGVDPWQQKTIDRIAADVTLLADNTRDTTAFGDTHRQTLWTPAFQRDVGNLYIEARTLTQSAKNAVEHAKGNRQHETLWKDLNGKSSF